MPFTSKLGTIDSLPNNIKIGDGSNTSIFSASMSDSLSMSDTFVGFPAVGVGSDTLTFTDTIDGFKNAFFDILTLSDLISPQIKSLQTLSDTLSFSESIVHTIFAEFDDTLDLSDDYIEGVPQKVGPFSDALTLTESLLEAVARGALYGDLLEFAQSFKLNLVKLLPYSDTLTFSDTMDGYVGRVFGDSMTFSDVISAFVSKVMQDTLEFGEQLIGNHVSKRSLTDQVVLFDSLAIQIFTRQSFADTIVLVDTLTGNATRPFRDTMSFTDSIAGVATTPIADTVTFTDNLTFVRVINLGMSDNLILTDSTTLNKVLSVQIADAIIFIEQWQAIRAKFGVMSDSIDLTDEQLRSVHPVTMTDTLVLSDSFTVIKQAGREMDDVLSLADAMTVQSILKRTNTDSVLFLDAFVVKIFPGPMAGPPPTQIIQQVPPPTGLENPPFPVWEAVLPVYPQLTMTGRTLSIVLPPPEFNDFSSGQGKIAVQRSMTGRFRVYAKRTQREKLNWRFILPKYKADELRNFLLAEIDTNLNVVTWEGDYWSLQILSDSVDFTESGRWAPCGNKVEVTIELVGNRYA